MTVDPEIVRRLEAKLKTNKEYQEEVETTKKIDSEVQDCIDEMCISEDDSIHSTIRKGHPQGRAKIQYTWRQRACIIIFYFHPRLGKKLGKKVSETYNIPSRTVLNWISSKKMIPKWLSFAKSLTM